jgi:RHS repeat-associated protein
MDDKQRIALIETRNDVSDGSPQQLIRYQFGNHLGSASLELDDQAQIISYEEYTPYGNTSYRAVRSQTEAPKRYRYTAKERDEESGFYYHGARYYAPWLGRWTRYDPAYMKSGPNLYEYVLNNPIRFYDPDGASAGELADKWANVSIFGWTPGSYIPGLTGEKVVAYAEHFMDRAIGAALDAQPKGTGLVASAQRLGAEVGATVLKTAGTVLVNIVAGAFIDPGYAARGVMHLGEGAAAGYENVKKGNIAVGVSQIVGDVSSAVLTVTPAIKGGLSLARRIPTGAPKGVSPTAKPAGGEGSPLEHITDEEIERAVQEEPKSGTLEKTPAKSDKQVRAEKEAAHKTQKKAWEEAGRENRSIAEQNWLFEKYGIWDIEEHSMGGDLGPGAGCWEDEIQPRPGYDLVPSGDKTVLVRKAQSN